MRIWRDCGQLSQYTLTRLPNSGMPVYGAVHITKVCPKSTCVKEQFVYDKHRTPLNNLQGILCALNCLYILAVLYI